MKTDSWNTEVIKSKLRRKVNCGKTRVWFMSLIRIDYGPLNNLFLSLFVNLIFISIRIEFITGVVNMVKNTEEATGCHRL